MTLLDQEREDVAGGTSAVNPIPSDDSWRDDGNETIPSKSSGANEDHGGNEKDMAIKVGPADSTETTATKTNITPTTKKNHVASRKNKKRSRKDIDDFSARERQLALKQERYDKLLYMAKKQLTKQAKKVRAFMVQRNIRKLKNNNLTTKESGRNAEDGEDSSQQQQQQQQEQQQEQQQQQHQQRLLQPLRDLSLDLVVQQAIRQLGLIHANPDPETSFAPPVPLPAQQSKLISSVLDHKRFQAALEEWNEKVADFRRFCLQLDDSNNKFPSGDSLPAKKGKKGKRGSNPTTSLRPQWQPSTQDQPTSYFCSSLNDKDGADFEEEEDYNNDIAMNAYGPAASLMEGDLMKPKNRRGQRARKAKAIAVQAKKEGRTYQSLNWREEKKKKKRTDDGRSSSKSPRNNPVRHDDNKNNNKSSSSKYDVAETKPPPSVRRQDDDPASHHPSWVAKQQQKSGIVAFQGKKITFE